MLAMKKILFVLFFVTMLLSCDEWIKKIGGGPYYVFNITPIKLVERIKIYKSKNVCCDVVEYNDSTMTFSSSDGYSYIYYSDDEHPLVHYNFKIYDSTYNSIAICSINLGRYGSSNAIYKGYVRIGGYAFPQIVDSSSCGVYKKRDSLSFIDSRLNYFDIKKESPEQEIVMKSVENFLDKIGIYKVSFSGVAQK